MFTLLGGSRNLYQIMAIAGLFGGIALIDGLHGDIAPGQGIYFFCIMAVHLVAIFNSFNSSAFITTAGCTSTLKGPIQAKLTRGIGASRLGRHGRIPPGFASGFVDINARAKVH